MTSETPKKKRRWILYALGAVFAVVFLCVIIGTLLPGSESTPTPPAVAEAEAAETTEPTATAVPTDAAAPTETAAPTSTPGPADTPAPTATSTITPEPTSTSKPSPTPGPTSTPTMSLLVRPGTYLVNSDIRPGIYSGEAGLDLSESCYWARLKDLGGTFDSIIANGNAIGPYYVEVPESDYALETACHLVLFPTLPGPPDQYPTKLGPGMYIVGTEIQPGTYKGLGGADILDSCYWARLRDVRGELDSIIANDNAIGQFYIQVSANDFALQTACDLELVE